MTDFLSQIRNKGATSAQLNEQKFASSTLDLTEPPDETKFENDKFNWLTYESVYNSAVYRHTDKSWPMGIFNMPVGALRIIVASNVFAKTPQWDFLRNAFFPNMSDASLKALIYAPWEDDNPDYEKAWNGKHPGIAKAVEDDAKKNNTDARARFPYNLVNNYTGAKCLGTRPQGEPNIIGYENESWPMWQTASRSCFVRPAARKSTVKPNVDVDRGDNQFIYPSQSWPQKGVWRCVGIGNIGVKGEVASADAFDMRNMDECYSVKTGAMYVGTKPEGLAHVHGETKATLEPNSVVATLRTEFMIAMNDYYKSRGSSTNAMKARADLTILPEVLTVTCLKSTVLEGNITGYESKVDESTAGLVEVYNDGFQLRDLTDLKKDMVYFPALSALWVKPKDDFKKFQDHRQLSKDDFPEWAAYWSPNFAGRIGKAKALLHLLYGFAPQTPNMQNFVFEAASLTGSFQKKPRQDKDSDKEYLDERFRRIVLRDVGDYRLHTSWVRLVLTEKGEPTELRISLCDDAKPLKIDPRLPVQIKRLFAYEKTTLAPTYKEMAARQPGESLLSSSEAGVNLPENKTKQVVYQYTSSTLLKDTPKINEIRCEEPVPGLGEVLKERDPNALNGARYQYWGGLQLNFFAYSAPYRGDRIDREAEILNWRRAYCAMLDWGLTHAMAFIETVNNALTDDLAAPVALKYQDKPITRSTLEALRVNEPHDVTEKPDPGKATFSIQDLRPLLDDKAKKADMTQMHKRLCAWDFFVSGIIEDAIYKDSGVRQSLRKFVRGS